MWPMSRQPFNASNTCTWVATSHMPSAGVCTHMLMVMLVGCIVAVRTCSSNKLYTNSLGVFDGF